MSNLLKKITEDLAKAQKGKNELAVSALRLLLSNLHNAKIAKGDELTDQEILTEIKGAINRYGESIESFLSADRRDLADKEKTEMEIISPYLPKPLDDEELENMVEQAIRAIGAEHVYDVGRVIRAVLGSAGVRADGARVARIAREKLMGKK